MSNYVLLLLWLVIGISVRNAISKWRESKYLEVVIWIMSGISAGYLGIFLPIMIYFWPLEKYGNPPFFKFSFILFVINTAIGGILVILYILNEVESNIGTEKWTGD